MRTGFIAAMMLLACGTPQLLAQQQEASVVTFKLTSTAFPHGGEIPAKYTCEGQDTSPPLAWSGVPPNAKSLVLIVDDPDAPDPAAPKMTWVHWVLYNIPPTPSGLPEAVKSTELPAGTHEGVNGWDRTGYGGPCPPIGRRSEEHTSELQSHVNI